MALGSLLRYAKSRSENVFLMFLTGSVASELMWIIRLRNEHDLLATDTKTQLKAMDRIILKLRSGEQVNVKEELLVKDTESYDDILRNIQELDTNWRNETTKPVSLGDLRAPTSQQSRFL